MELNSNQNCCKKRHAHTHIDTHTQPMSDSSEDGGDVATNLSRRSAHYRQHQLSNNSSVASPQMLMNSNSRSSISSNSSGSDDDETQILAHHHHHHSSSQQQQLMPVGKVIDNIVGSSRNVSSNTDSSTSSSQTVASGVLLDLRTGILGPTLTVESAPEVATRPQATTTTPAIVISVSSGSEDERVPSTGEASPEALPSSPQVQPATVTTTPPPHSSEIAIDTDTDDDVILVAPQMEVIEVQDEDDEDVQIVSQSHATIPKPLPDSSNNTSSTSSNTSSSNYSSSISVSNSGTNTLLSGSKLRPRLLQLQPPTLPDISEIEDTLEDNLPVERLLGDLFDSHFGPLDFELPSMELPPSAHHVATAIPSTSNMHHNGSLAESIHGGSMKRGLGVEIAVQTETTRKEFATQTDEVVEPKKRKW